MSPLGLLRGRTLWPLALAQSCGALNDNLVKNAMLVLALFKLGQGGAGLSALAGALFIAPYVLLSATAGKLADRFPKPRLVLIYKVAEAALMAAAALGFLAASVPALLAVLVGLGVQAALFGPVKYGVLPEYLAPEELLAGNAVIEATTFLSIVVGTVAGGGLMLLDAGAAVTGAAGLALAAIGLLGAACMPARQAADPSLRIRWNVLGETAAVLQAARRVRPIWRSLLAVSWFWVIGATLLTEFPVIVRDTMRASGSVLTELLAVFAVGVGVGSIATPRLLKNRLSARFAPYAATGISLFCWDFANAAYSATGADARLLIDLSLLAACGGVFSVPFYAIMQDAALPAQRSRTVAANNIMNALFMVAGSAAAAGLAAAGLDAPAVLKVAAGVNLLAASEVALAFRR